LTVAIERSASRRFLLAPASRLLSWRQRARERAQRRLIAKVLARNDLAALFAQPTPLPRHFGVGSNERAIEIPWLFAQRPRGRVLDAGSSLNHSEYLGPLADLADEIHIVTLAYEGVAFPERGVSYLFEDLRNLPYRDNFFDTVLSVSTLEHVGMDNIGYGSGRPRAADPAREVDQAVRELVRVVAPGGMLLVSVPYGQPEDHGWFRQFARVDVEQLIGAVDPREAEVAVYRYGDTGWQVSDLEQAGNARYRGNAGAEAVACLRLRT
jgi:SAM-dependent methyltransferase